MPKSLAASCEAAIRNGFANGVGSTMNKELYYECGMIGQQLCLEATSLGLKNNLYQSMYHFTVGVGYVDSRIQTTPPYPNRV